MKKVVLPILIVVAAICSFAQAPANNLPCNATLINVNTSCVYVNYNSTNATPSTVPQPTGPSCAGWGQGRDVWFRLIVPANGSVTISGQQQSILTFSDGVMAAYSGPNCNNLTLIQCDDDGGPGLMPQIVLVGRTPGETIWIRFWRHSNSATATGGQFQFCATNAVPNQQDCLGAIPICQLNFSTTTSYTGVGNVPGEVSPTSCLINGERNSVWYTFTVQTAGNLNFTITPNNSTNDYDWAVYNLTNANCSDITSNSSLEVSCNYSATTGATGTQNGSTSNNQGASGTPFNAPIPVTAGQTFAVLVSNFSTTNQSGYNINFSNSTATIVDNVPPRLRTLDSIPKCGENTISFSFTENVLCNTVQAGDFSLTGPNGNIPITAVTSFYCQLGTTYDNNFTVTTATPLIANGSYSLCLTSTAGNVSDLCGNLSQSTSPCITFNVSEITLTTSKVDVVCRGASTGSATVSATGASGNYTYNWSNGGTTATINGLAAGTYQVTVTSGACTKTASVVVNEPATGITATTTTTSANCAQADGSATANAQNGVGAITYIWSNGQTTQTANNLAAGNYSVTVRDANNCTAVAAAVVSNQGSNLAVVVAGDTACLTPGQGSVSATPSGGSPGYTYIWSNGQTTPTLNNLANGVYTVTVRDAVNCSVTASTGVLRYPTINFNPSSSTNSNCGQTDGTATVNPTAGGAGFTYLWSNGQTTQTANNLVAGSYTVTVRDANNCTASTAVNVANQASTLAITLRGDTACDAPTATRVIVTATGGASPYTYLWSNGITTDTVENLANGSYSVTVRDAVNCTVTGTTGVLRYAPIIFNAASVTNATCGLNNGSATVNPTGGSGGFIYQWSNGQSLQTASSLGAGVLTVTVTDQTQCTNSTSVSIAQSGSPTINNVSKTDETCFGANNGTATATATGGSGVISYLWSNGQTGALATGLAGGTYDVIATDANGCADTASVNINSPDSIAITLNTLIDADCFGANTGSITVSAGGGSGNINLQWSNGQSGASASNLTAGTYTVTATDANNCTNTRGFAITEPSDISIQITISDALCFGGNSGSATATASGSAGNYSYAWSNGQSNATANNLVAGTYTVTVSSNQCTKTAQAVVGEPTQPIAIAFSTTPSSCSQPDGTATATPSNGSGVYVYEWSNGQTTQTATGLASGSYSVTVRDANNCTATSNVSVPNQNTTLFVSVRGDTACGNIGQGFAVATVGSALPFTILWSNGQTTDTAANLANGTYAVTVTDAQGCSVTATTNVLRHPEIQFNTPSTTPAVCGLDNGSATVNPTAGGGAFTYLWSNGQTNQTITNLPAGVFAVTVTDANSCTAQTLITVAQDGGPDITGFSQTDVSCFGGNNGTATVVASGGVGNISYLWSNGQTTTTATNLSAGNYIVTATDGNGCIATQIYTINQPAAFNLANSTLNQPLCNGDANGSITATFNGGTGTLSLVWSNGDNGTIASNIAAGVYTVTVTDENNCTTVRNFTLNQPSAAMVNVVVMDALCFGQASGTATAIATGGTPPFSYQWSNFGTTSTNANQLPAGNYQVTATDANNCSASQSFNVGEPTQVSVSAVATPVSCAESTDGVISPVGSGGTIPYTFDLNGNLTTTTFENLAVGSYTVVVRDANNCSSSVQVNVPPAQEDAFNVETDSTTCFGDVYRDGKISVSPIFPVNGPYYYSLDGINYRSSGLFDSLGHGTYLVYIKSEKGCESAVVATVEQPEKLIVNINPNLLQLDLGASGMVEVSVNSKYNATYEWSPTEGLSCNDCPSPVFSPFSETLYTVTVKDWRTNRKFCTATAKLTVEVGPQGDVLIPNLFSPNGDGVNDVFFIYANHVRDLNLKIFNRWGEKVFETNNMLSGWDGTYKGVLQMPGIYTYTAELVFLNNAKFFKSGTVTMTR